MVYCSIVAFLFFWPSGYDERSSKMSRLSNSRQQKMRAPVKSVSYTMSKALSLLTKRPGGALTFGYLRLCLLLDHTCIGVSWHRIRDSGSSRPGCTVNATNMDTKGVGRPCWYEMAFSQRKIGLPNKADVLTGDLLVHALPCGAANFFFSPLPFFRLGFGFVSNTATRDLAW